MKKLVLFLLLPLLFSSCQEERTVIVADHFGVNQSFLIKERVSDSWSTYKTTINGFAYQEGYEYKLKVKVESKKNGEVTYSLLEVLSKKKTNYLNNQLALKSIQEKNWVVTQLLGYKNDTGKKPNFNLSKGRIYGNAGCNDFEGTAHIDYNGLFKIDRLNATKKYCKPFMKLEEAFMQRLAKANQYKIVNNELVILDKVGNHLFIAKEDKEVELTGNWTVIESNYFNNNTDKKVSFSISNGQIKGNSGCNTFGGALETDASGLFIADKIMATKRYCEAYMILERNFFESLSKAKSFRIINNELHVLDKAHNLIFTAIKTKETSSTSVVEYNTYSKNLAIRNKLEGKQFTYYDLQPTPTKPSLVMLSDEDFAFFTTEIEKLDLNTLAHLRAPSTKFKQNTAVAASLLVTKNGKLVRVPTFDHGNPPEELKVLIERIMLLRK